MRQIQQAHIGLRGFILPNTDVERLKQLRVQYSENRQAWSEAMRAEENIRQELEPVVKDLHILWSLIQGVTPVPSHDPLEDLCDSLTRSMKSW